MLDLLGMAPFGDDGGPGAKPGDQHGGGCTPLIAGQLGMNP